MDLQSNCEAYLMDFLPSPYFNGTFYFEDPLRCDQGEQQQTGPPPAGVGHPSTGGGSAWPQAAFSDVRHGLLLANNEDHGGIFGEPCGEAAGEEEGAEAPGNTDGTLDGERRIQYRGVSYDKKKRKWRVQIKVPALGKSGVSIGYFDEATAAARAYDRAALSLMGPDHPQASLNFRRADYDGDSLPELKGKSREEIKAALKLERDRSRLSRRRSGGTGCKRRTSQFVGVGTTNRENQWQTRILIDGKVTHLGYYPSETDAARVYDRVSLAINGAGASTNFPADTYPEEELAALRELPRGELQRHLGVKPMDKTSKFRGVSRKKKKWEAKVMADRKWVYRELFETEEEAARAYDFAIAHIKGSEATIHVNFKDSLQPNPDALGPGMTAPVTGSTKLAALRVAYGAGGSAAAAHAAATAATAGDSGDNMDDESADEEDVGSLGDEGLDKIIKVMSNWDNIPPGELEDRVAQVRSRQLNGTGSIPLPLPLQRPQEGDETPAGSAAKQQQQQGRQTFEQAQQALEQHQQQQVAGDARVDAWSNCGPYRVAQQVREQPQQRQPQQGQPMVCAFANQASTGSPWQRQPPQQAAALAPSPQQQRQPPQPQQQPRFSPALQHSPATEYEARSSHALTGVPSILPPYAYSESDGSLGSRGRQLSAPAGTCYGLPDSSSPAQQQQQQQTPMWVQHLQQQRQELLAVQHGGPSHHHGMMQRSGSGHHGLMPQLPHPPSADAGAPPGTSNAAARGGGASTLSLAPPPQRGMANPFGGTSSAGTWGNPQQQRPPPSSGSLTFNGPQQQPQQHSGPGLAAAGRSMLQEIRQQLQMGMVPQTGPPGGGPVMQQQRQQHSGAAMQQQLLGGPMQRQHSDTAMQPSHPQYNKQMLLQRLRQLDLEKQQIEAEMQMSESQGVGLCWPPPQQHRQQQQPAQGMTSMQPQQQVPFHVQPRQQPWADAREQQQAMARQWGSPAYSPQHQQHHMPPPTQEQHQQQQQPAAMQRNYGSPLHGLSQLPSQDPRMVQGHWPPYQGTAVDMHAHQASRAAAPTLASGPGECFNSSEDWNATAADHENSVTFFLDLGRDVGGSGGGLGGSGVFPYALGQEQQQQLAAELCAFQGPPQTGLGANVLEALP